MSRALKSLNVNVALSEDANPRSTIHIRKGHARAVSRERAAGGILNKFFSVRKENCSIEKKKRKKMCKKCFFLYKKDLFDR